MDLLYPLPARTSIPASTQNYYKGRTRAIRVIVIHDMEAPERADTAEAVGNWFANPAAGGSTQVGVDSNSICRYVSDADTVWGAKGVNADGLHIEQAGFARQSAAEWMDDYSKRTIENAAIIAAEWSFKYSISRRWLTDSEIRNGVTKGFLTHRDATRALNVSGGHTDPGPNYPRDYFMSRVNFHYARITGSQPPPPGKPAIVKLVEDGDFGRKTITRLQQRLAEAKCSGVDGKQLKIDGVYGDNTAYALTRYLSYRAKLLNYPKIALSKTVAPGKAKNNVDATHIVRMQLFCRMPKRYATWDDATTLNLQKTLNANLF